MNILAAVGSGICVVQIFGMVLACCLYVKLKDVEQWHAHADPTFFSEDPQSTDGVSLIYGQDTCPVHSNRNGSGNRNKQSDIDGIYPMDVVL